MTQKLKPSGRYGILFESVKVGPVTAPNRFIQVPHCNGLGHGRPFAEARNRGIKAEGGWGIVSTQEVEIHPSAEVSPFLEGRLWDDNDIPYHRLVTEAIHEHGSLAAIELVHMGRHVSNRTSRIAPLAPSHLPVDGLDPVNARAMSKRDINDLRRWHVDAAKRSMEAGYDIVYVYAAHNMSVLMHFLQARVNNRSDEYGGSLTNRIRIVREILEAVKDAVGHKCGIAFRLAVDELLGPEGIQAKEDGSEIISELSELPDLWDVNVSDWSNDSATARFEPEEGYQLPYTDFVKSLTTRPVVGVGRFTSADKMVSLVEKGVLDFIGAARPSIADPFLPTKIREDRIDEIRECIGCNICVASDNIIAPIRCTQNPTMGEEWRKGWHPESIEPAHNDDQVLVVGAGPAGLECSLQLAERGYKVMLAEAREELGGRSLLESRLPGLASYKRVADYRIGLLRQHVNAEIFTSNKMSAEDIIEMDVPHVCIATGSSWSRRGAGRTHHHGINTDNATKPILTPDDLIKNLTAETGAGDISGLSEGANVLVYDDDHYYMGGVIAELLLKKGCRVTLATPEATVSSWTEHTLEQDRIHSQLLRKGVSIECNKKMAAINESTADLACTYGGKSLQIELDAVVMVTARLPNTTLFDQLQPHYTDANDAAPTTLRAIGDCHAPSTIAAAVYQGHLFARNLGATATSDYALDYTREFVDLEKDQPQQVN